MNRACAIPDEQLVAFAGGNEFDLDEHVATCDQCQDFLAELWDGGLDHDLVEPVVGVVMRARFELGKFAVAAVRFMSETGDLCDTRSEARFGLLRIGLLPLRRERQVRDFHGALRALARG